MCVVAEDFCRYRGVMPVERRLGRAYASPAGGQRGRGNGKDGTGAVLRERFAMGRQNADLRRGAAQRLETRRVRDWRFGTQRTQSHLLTSSLVCGHY